MTGADPVSITARSGDYPHLARRRTVRGTGDVGGAILLECLAASEGDQLRIRRPGQLADVEAVILGEARERARLHPMRGVRDPDVAAPLRVEHPGDRVVVAR